MELDQRVNLTKSVPRVGSSAAIRGNVGPVSILAQGTPAAAEQAAMEAIKSAGPARFILSSGCTVVTDTPAANLDAFLQTSR